MSALNGKWIEIFQAGDYGEKGVYTAADLGKLAASYDRGKHEAPVVLGHPENNSPAYGWVESLKVEGDKLLARLGQVQPEFEELLRSGKFKKRSVALYQPKDGGMYLRHVGFLGALPPQVKGLADVKFAGAFKEAKFEEVEFNQESEMSEDKKTFVEALKEFFGEWNPKKNAGSESKTFSEDDVKRISKESADAAVKTATTELQGQVTELTKKFNDAQQKAATQVVLVTADSAIAKLKTDGKWIPAFDKMGAPQIFAELAKSEAKVEFTEGDKKTEKPVLQVFADFLGGLKQIVPEGDISKSAVAAKKGGKLIQFTEPSNGNSAIDQESVRFAEAAQELADKEKITFGEALKKVRRQGLPQSTTANAV